jgi:hypothetical protein
MQTVPAPSRGKRGKQELLKMQVAVGKKKGITAGPYPRNNTRTTMTEPVDRPGNTAAPPRVNRREGLQKMVK